ncbi:hypothetical protein EYD25_25310 [Klebsiella pneumoniae]|nr:hypothetical protein EYD25_25310 [Klebsiella pneumoniae]
MFSTEKRRASLSPDQTRPDQTRPDQTRPDQTRPVLSILLQLFLCLTFFSHNLPRGHLRLLTRWRGSVVEPHSANREKTR